MRSSRGQASVEYVAVVALVAVVLGAGAALTAGGLGPPIAHAIRLGLCHVSGTPCPPAPADRADLPPCPLHEHTRSQRASVAVAFVRLGGGLTLREQRWSDGSEDVEFADAGQGDLEGSLGASWRLGGGAAGAAAEGGIGVGWTQGRSWHFRTRRAAREFIARYGDHQTLAGRLLDDARALCLPCQVLGAGPDLPPPPDVRWDELDAHGAAVAMASLGGGAEAELAAKAVLGIKRERGGRRTVYVELGGEASAQLLVLAAGIRASGAASGVAAVQFRGARPVAVSLEVAAEGAGAGLDGRWAAVRGAEGWRGGGRLLEAEASLDLTEPGARAAFGRLVAALRPDRASALPGAVAAVARRLARDAAIDVRRYRVETGSGAVGAKLGAGLEAGGELGAGYRDVALEAELTRLPGLPFLPRDDCAATSARRA